jgi:membrane fusion protein, heavy metal efflux system
VNDRGPVDFRGDEAMVREVPMTQLPQSEPASAPTAPGIRARVLGIGAAVLLVLGIGGAVVLRGGKAAGGGPAAASKRDVPYLDGKAIAFSSAFRDRAGIKMSRVESAHLTPVVKVVGTVDFDPAHVAAVGTRIRGFVRNVYKVEGDHVSTGDSLAEIESAELGQAQADVSVAQAHRHAAELNAKREAELLGRQLTTAREAEVAAAAAAEHRASLTAAQQRVTALGGNTKGGYGVYVLRSPMKGEVVEWKITPGQSVEGNVVAFRVADLNYLWIELAVFERNISAVRVDDKVDITLLSDASTPIVGKVAHVGEVIDLNTRSAAVRVKVHNTARVLRPGQSVMASIHASGPARMALSVPQSAITYVDGKPTVFVAESDTRVVPTAVRLGGSDGTKQEVLEGLSEGQQVASEGVFALKSELFRLAT